MASKPISPPSRRSWLYPREVAAILGIERSTLINWEKAGVLHPLITFGKHRRYDREEIEQLLVYVKANRARGRKARLYRDDVLL